MESEERVYLLYCEDGELRDRLERVLAGVAVQRVNLREELLAPSMSLCGTVYGTATCSDDEAAWLRSDFGPLSPPCVVVASLSVESVRRLYPLRSGRLRIVWTEEVEDCLGEVLDEFSRAGRGPLRGLGLGLLSEHSLRPSLRETIRRACGLHQDANGTRFVPEKSVDRLACVVNMAPSTLRQYWREDVPLRCGLKEFLSWAVLLWTLRARARGSWSAIAEEVGLQRRTLERNFIRMAGCTLAAAAEDPERVIGRFNEWVHSVWDPPAVNGSRNNNALPGAEPGAPAP